MSVASSRELMIRSFIQRCESVVEESSESHSEGVNLHISNILETCNSILNTQDNNFEQLEVEYESKNSCCLIGCRSICSFWSFCQRVNCFGITHNYYTATPYAGGIRLHPTTTFRLPTTTESQLTNASFFVELHKSLGVYLIPAWKLSVVYIEDVLSKADAAYWESWDPLSKEYTPQHQMDVFREIITDAAAVMKKARQQAMRGVLTRKDAEIAGPQRRRGRSVGQVSLHSIEMQKLHLTEEKGEGEDNKENEELQVPTESFESKKPKTRIRSDSIAINNLIMEFENQSLQDSSSADEFFTPPDTMPGSSPTPRVKEEVSLISSAEDISVASQRKTVVFQEGMIPFDRARIVRDILEITLATRTQANLIVDELEQDLLFPCSVKEKWDAIKKALKKKGISLKDSQESEIPEALSNAIVNDFYLQDENHLREMEQVVIQQKRRKKRNGLFGCCKI